MLEHAAGATAVATPAINSLGALLGCRKAGNAPRHMAFGDEQVATSPANPAVLIRKRKSAGRFGDVFGEVLILKERLLKGFHKSSLLPLRVRAFLHT